MRKHVLAFGLAGAALFLLGCDRGTPPPAAPEPAAVTPAPAGAAADAPPAPEISAAYWLNTEPLTLAGLRGKPVVVEFWATWCPPCRTSIPHLAELHAKYGPRGLTLISLSNEPRTTVEPFATQMKMTWPIGGGSETFQAYGVKGIPHAALLDAEGRIVWRGSPMDPAFEQAIESLLK